MDQWQPYSNAPGAPRRQYSDSQQPGQQPSSRYNGAAQPPAQPGYGYDQYQGGLTSHPQSMNASPALPSSARDGNGDIAMQDASGDPYSGVKYPMRPHHQQHLSASRVSSHQGAGEQSSAAQRYSPMETLSPTTPYTASPNTNQNPYAAARQSPTRAGNYSSPNSYYSNRSQTQQLPPITPYASSNEGYPSSATAQLNAMFGNDPKSPRVRQVPQQTAQNGKGPVPEFQKIRATSELQPKINSQPAFRRANPEGGFISVRSI